MGGGGGGRGSPTFVCVHVCPRLHMLFRCGTDGEGKEERPIGNSIKNTSRTGAEAERKKVVMII